MLRKVLVINLCVALAACAGMGGNGDHPSPFDSAYLKAHVIPGHTTENEIAEMFGPPYKKQSYPAQNKDVWIYSSTASGGQGNKLLSLAGVAAGWIPGAGLLAQAGAAGQVVGAQTGASKPGTMMFEFNSGNGTVKDWFGDVQ